jgi:serine/threonine-protein kinase HipA
VWRQDPVGTALPVAGGSWENPTEIIRLLDMVVVNVLACNTDAHAKNYSIMIRAGGALLAPMYDVMCGEVWENVTKKFAQKIAGERRGDHLKGKHWQRLARECGLNPNLVLDRVGALAKAAIAEAGAAESEVRAMPAGGHPVLDQTRQAVECRARAVLAQLQELGDDPVADVAEEERMSPPLPQSRAQEPTAILLRADEVAGGSP